MQEKSRAVVVFLLGDTEVASWPLRAPGSPDLAVLDRLARLHLLGRRLGLAVQVRGASADLRGLLELCGLTGLLGGGQVVGQPERLEQRGVEKVVVPDDPAV